uniref:SFRICE_028624 n=1 Tax=Spodoptera frugiperda TaxID=7108 RepID=A0A2H1W723_SPOFR
MDQCCRLSTTLQILPRFHTSPQGDNRRVVCRGMLLMNMDLSHCLKLVEFFVKQLHEQLYQSIN